jgi:hypothetical protein
VEAEAEVRGRLVHVLSPSRVLLEQERKRISEFEILEQQRIRGLGEIEP